MPAQADPGRVRVFIVDDHALFRAGLRAELAGRVWIVGEGRDVEESIAGIIRTRPQVVLLDVHLPFAEQADPDPRVRTGGAAVVEGVRAAGPFNEVRFLALSASDTPDDVVATILAGARGYVVKTVSPDELVAAIRRVAAGDAVFSPRLAGYVLDAFAALPIAQVDEELAALTRREREVLQHIARGYTYREIGARLFITAKTVESHVSAVLRKLQLDNRHALARWASQRNIH